MIINLLKEISTGLEKVASEYPLNDDELDRVVEFRKKLRQLIPHALKPGGVDVIKEVSKAYSKLFQGRQLSELKEWELKALNIFIPTEEQEGS